MLNSSFGSNDYELLMIGVLNMKVTLDVVAKQGYVLDTDLLQLVKDGGNSTHLGFLS